MYLQFFFLSTWLLVPFVKRHGSTWRIERFGMSWTYLGFQ